MTVYGYLELAAVVFFFLCLFVRRFRWRGMALAAVLLVATLLIHGLRATPRSGAYALTVLPPEEDTFILAGRLIDERDFVFWGTKAYTLSQGADAFGDEFRQAYDRLEGAAEGPLVTPFFSSLRDDDAVTRTWVMRFDPVGGRGKPAIYLHGAAGSYVVQCWLFAEVLRARGYSTICPSFSFKARWFEPIGQQVLERTVDFAKKEFPGEKILFAGLSNGAMGLSRHRERWAAEASGFVYISGGDARPITDALPTIALWGTLDRNVPFDIATAMKAANPGLTLVSRDSDHSAFIREHDYFAKELGEWLTSTESSSPR